MSICTDYPEPPEPRERLVYGTMRLPIPHGKAKGDMIPIAHGSELHTGVVLGLSKDGTMAALQLFLTEPWDDACAVGWWRDAIN